MATPPGRPSSFLESLLGVRAEPEDFAEVCVLRSETLHKSTDNLVSWVNASSSRRFNQSNFHLVNETGGFVLCQHHPISAASSRATLRVGQDGGLSSVS